jgi:phenylacetate-CoA ligase
MAFPQNDCPCTSDKLTDAMRASMKSIFQVPVTSYYGCGEVMGVSGDCEKISQHISEEHIILETVDDDGRPVVDKPGRILLTDLDNYAMPLVLYEVGDIGIITHEPCTCGRVHTILQEITGRLSETLDLANSRRIAPSYWSVLFRPIEQIKRGCVRIVKPDHLEIDLVLSAPIPEENYVYLKESVAEAVGAGIRVDWREVDTIPRVRSGKYPWVRKAEDEIPDEEAG